tara:strand:- start:1499 stop:1735 length:237 start_codon:yes stop_codon:yes gene_type:complete
MLFLNKNFLTTVSGSVFVVALIIVVLIMIDRATASSGYSCGGKKEMYEKKKAPIPEDKMRRIEAKRKRMRERQKKIYR